MAKQWRNLSVVVVVVVVIALVYVLSTMQPAVTPTAKTPFEANFESMQLIWAEQGIPVKGMDEVVHDWVYDLTEEDLDMVKDQLLELKAENAGQDAATDALLDVYISYVAWIKKDLEAVALSTTLDNEMTLDNTCEYLPTLKERNALLLESIDLGKRYAQKAKSFDTTYTDAARITGVFIPIVDEAWLQENAAVRDEAEQGLEEMCRGVI